MALPPPIPAPCAAYRRSHVDTAGRFVFVRNRLKPRRWVLYDLWSLVTQDPVGMRVGTYPTLTAAKQAAVAHNGAHPALPPNQNQNVDSLWPPF